MVKLIQLNVNGIHVVTTYLVSHNFTIISIQLKYPLECNNPHTRKKKPERHTHIHAYKHTHAHTVTPKENIQRPRQLKEEAYINITILALSVTIIQLKAYTSYVNARSADYVILIKIVL